METQVLFGAWRGSYCTTTTSDYRRPAKASKKRALDPAAISSAHLILGGGNVWILIGPRRRDRWMHVHHPRLVKRRYLLLNSAPRHFLPILQPSLSSFGFKGRYIIFFLSFPRHIPISARVDASRKQKRYEV